MAWADFTKKISQTTQDASDKMKKMAEISRLNSEINSAEDRIRQICNEVGAYVVNNNLYTEDKMIADAHERIRAIREQTAANQAKVYELKGMVPCKKCGNMVSTSSRFCDKCGAPVEVPVPAQPQAPAGPVCVNCGAPLEPGALFCGNCGTRQPGGRTGPAGGTPARPGPCGRRTGRPGSAPCNGTASACRTGTHRWRRVCLLRLPLGTRRAVLRRVRYAPGCSACGGSSHGTGNAGRSGGTGTACCPRSTRSARSPRGDGGHLPVLRCPVGTRCPVLRQLRDEGAVRIPIHMHKKKDLPEKGKVLFCWLFSV